MKTRLGTKNLILVGFMGTGKSTIGRLLAERLGRKFIDTDCLIEEWSQRRIPLIFADQGEATFRQWELKVAEHLAHRKNLVVATGGGFVTSTRCVTLISATAEIYTLTASPAEIYARTQFTDRPLLRVKDPEKRIADLLEKRATIYNQFPQIDTTEKTPEEITEQILEIIR